MKNMVQKTISSFPYLNIDAWKKNKNNTHQVAGTFRADNLFPFCGEKLKAKEI